MHAVWEALEKIFNTRNQELEKLQLSDSPATASIPSFFDRSESNNPCGGSSIPSSRPGCIPSVLLADCGATARTEPSETDTR